MESQIKAADLGMVLVVGGCGLVGFHIVHLLVETGCDSVSVVSRTPTNNLLDRVSYYTDDISNKDQVESRLAKIKPNGIFHTASPVESDPIVAPEEFRACEHPGH
jgi:sterol-4alpha-carboxylate 3-dehydrogenase (decarboxylating)